MSKPRVGQVWRRNGSASDVRITWHDDDEVGFAMPGGLLGSASTECFAANYHKPTKEEGRMRKKAMHDQMQIRMEPTLHDAVRAYAKLMQKRTGVRTLSVSEATRMAIRAGLVAAGIDPDAPHDDGEVMQ